MHSDIETIRRFNVNRIFVIDTETTGLDPMNDEVLSLAIVDVFGRPLFDRLVKPLKRRSWPKAQEINGISPGDVADKAHLVDYSQEIMGFFQPGCLIVGYNVQYDLKMLFASGLDIRNVTTFDVMEEAKKLVGRRIKLVDCATRYGYRDFAAHGACEDAKATAYCFRALLNDSNYIACVEDDDEPVIEEWSPPASLLSKRSRLADARNYTQISETGPLKGEIVCITGNCTWFGRDKVMEAICANGGKPCNNVTLKTTMLVDFSGMETTKVKKAREYGPRTGIRIVDGTRFLESVGITPGTAAPAGNAAILTPSPPATPRSAAVTSPMQSTVGASPRFDSAAVMRAIQDVSSQDDRFIEGKRRKLLPWIAVLALVLVSFVFALLFVGVAITATTTRGILVGALLSLLAIAVFGFATVMLWRR